MDGDAITSLLSAIRDVVSKPSSNDEDIALPVFDPEKNDCGAASWCDSIEPLAKDLKWSSIKTAARAGKALKGSALSWFESWAPTEGRTWEKFRSDIIDAYPEKKNLSERLARAVLFTSDASESYSEYVREKLRLLRNTKISFTELQLIELICGGINDTNVKLASLNSNINTTSALIALLSSYTKSKKRPLENIEKDRNSGAGFSGVKRTRYNSDKKCYLCDQLGHIQSQCFKNKSSQSQQFQMANQSSAITKSNKPPVKICTFCKKIGHTESVCYYKQRSESSSSLITVPTKKEPNFLDTPN